MQYAQQQQQPQSTRQLALPAASQQQVHALQQQLRIAQQQGNTQAAQHAAQQLRAIAAQHTAQQPAPTAAGAQPQAQQAQATAQGITSRERELGDGDDQLRSAKRRKPTSRHLPSHFTPSLPASAVPSPTDTKLSASLAALDTLAGSYKRLQELEKRVDWTVERKKVEVADATGAGGAAGGRGWQIRRTLRIHVQTTLLSQPWQLSPSELSAAAQDVPADPATKDDISVGGAGGEVKAEGEGEGGEKKKEEEEGGEGKEPTVPRVEVKISGEVLDDPTSPAPPFSTYLRRLVLEAPALSPSVNPSSCQPLSWTRTSAPAPSHFRTTLPTSSPSLALRLTLYPAHPAGERFTALPALADALALPDGGETDRTALLEAVWAYAKDRGLVVGPEEVPQGMAGQGAAAARGGIKTDARLAKFFGNLPLVPFHLIPEYLNRCLAPAQGKSVDFSIDLSPSAPTAQHHAFDLPLQFPSSSAALLPSLSASLSTPAVDPRELAALDDKLALNCLAVASHLSTLDALAAFTRDPVGFVKRWTDSQAGSVADVLASPYGGGGAGGGKLTQGGRWKEDLRRSSALSTSEGEGGDDWVQDAARVYAQRTAEGALNAAKHAQAQQQVAGLQQQQQLAAQQQAQQAQQAMMVAQAQAMAQAGRR
ncbi:hypothetical protein JCM10207_001042 [Rhodosporidiobolus poonsookiae]